MNMLSKIINIFKRQELSNYIFGKDILFRFNNKGIVFAATMIIILLMVMINSYMFYMISQDIFMAQHIRDANEAQFIAEAGISKALETLTSSFANKDNAGLFPQTNFGDGVYDVTVVQNGGRVLLSSVGSVRGISRIVSVEVKNTASPSLNYAIASGQNINITGKTNVTGNIHSNQNANLTGGPINITNQGNISAVMHVNTTGTVNYTAEQESAPSVAIITPNFNFYKTLANNGGRYYSSLNLTGSGTIDTGTNGVAYVGGNANITGTYTINGCLIADKNINITGTLTQTKVGQYPAFMAKQNISVTGTLTAHGLLYSGQNINITSSTGTTITGALVANGNNVNITSSGTPVLTIIYEGQNPPDISSGGLEVVSWNR